MPNITDLECRALLALQARGHSRDQIARILGISARTVRRYMAPERAYRAWTKANDRDLLIGRGWTQREIAGELGRTLGSVESRLRILRARA